MLSFICHFCHVVSWPLFDFAIFQFAHIIAQLFDAFFVFCVVDDAAVYHFVAVLDSTPVDVSITRVPNMTTETVTDAVIPLAADAPSFAASSVKSKFATLTLPSNDEAHIDINQVLKVHHTRFGIRACTLLLLIVLNINNL